MNVSDTLRRSWGLQTLLPLNVLTETVKVPSVGHAFGAIELPPGPSGPPSYFVTDFLVDQSQSTGGGGGALVVRFTSTRPDL